MSSSTTSNPSRPQSVLMGTLAAFASFAVIAAILQMVAGGRPEDPTRADRLRKKEDVAKEQGALLEKYGLSGDPKAVFAKVEPQIKARKVSATTQVVPGSPTALKQAAAPAPVTPAPSATPPAAPPAPTPAAPASPPATSSPAPAPAPAAPATPPAPGAPASPATKP